MGDCLVSQAEQGLANAIAAKQAILCQRDSIKMGGCLISEAQRVTNASIAANRAEEQEEADDVISAYSETIKKAIKSWKRPEARKKGAKMASSFFSSHLCEIEPTQDVSLGQIIRGLSCQSFELQIRFRFDPDSPESVAHVLVHP